MDNEHPLTSAVIRGKRKEVPPLVHECLDAGESAQSIVEGRLVPAMKTVGDRFKNNEIFVPEMLIAARAMKAALAILEPILADAGIQPEFKALIATVEGDLHDIGKNLVSMMWKGANIEVIDLGVNITPAKFAEAVVEHNPDIVGLSALLTTTMPAMRETIDAIRSTDVTTKIVIGGAPVTQDFANEIGADGYAQDAGTAADIALELLKSA
jgi:5-methyltetrahydrofolate--homocysteine methyltransferase